MKNWEKKNEQRKRKILIRFYLSEDEIKQLDNMISHTVLDRSKFIRAALFNKKINFYVKDKSTEDLVNKVVAATTQLKYVSNSINQIARVVNRRELLNDLPETLNDLSDRLDGFKKEIKETEYRLYDLIEDYEF